MRLRPLHLIGLLLLASALSLSACGSDDNAKHGDDAKADEKAAEHKKAEAAKAAPICPQVAIVRGLDVLRDYGDEKPDPQQLTSAAKLLGIEGDCEYRKDGIDVAFHLNMAAARGPRLGGLHASFPFFVAVVDPDGQVLNKNQMTADVNFSSDEKIANHNEAVHVFIPLAKSKKAAGPYYRVLAGFQLKETPSQETTQPKP
jgi:hypothetical protein